MSQFRDEGVIIRTYRLGEADRIIVALTKEHGKVRAVAKGVRKTGSKFGSRLEPLTNVSLMLWRGRSDLDIRGAVFHARGVGCVWFAGAPKLLAWPQIVLGGHAVTVGQTGLCLRHGFFIQHEVVIHHAAQIQQVGRDCINLVHTHTLGRIPRHGTVDVIPHG